MILRDDMLLCNYQAVEVWLFIDHSIASSYYWDVEYEGGGAGGVEYMT